MVYTIQAGISKEQIGKLSLFFIALALAVTSTLAIFSTANASSHAHTFEFTQAELDDNWEADRRFPTDGATSVSEFDRDNVARLGLDSAETAPGDFQRTEGIKTVGANNFGSAVAVDLYLDPEWQDRAVRAGLWVVGDDGAGNRDAHFGILEFVNNEPCPATDCSNQGNITDHEGWRYWTSTTGWTNLNTPFSYGEWVTLSVELDTANTEYKFLIDGDEVATGPAGENFIREVFLNSYNYGLDEFPNLSNDSYAAHWHGGIFDPQSKDDCKDGGFEAFGFSNQGLCVQYANTGKDSR
jgi:hypothetical protein